MDVYTKQYVIQSSDVDMYRKLRISRLFTFMQEAAIHHTEQLGAGRAKTLDRGFLWVITMQHAQIVRLPEYDEAVTLRSWAGKTMHVMFPRYYELYDAEGKCIVRGSALWVLMDMHNRSMIFPDAEGIAVEGSVVGTEYALPHAIRPMDTKRTVVLDVPFSYADINGHLTNTKYFDIADDLSQGAANGKTPRYVAAEYAGEARYGERIDVAVHEDDGVVYVGGTKEQGKKVFKIKYEY